jgi:hypothetical protein
VCEDGAVSGFPSRVFAYKNTLSDGAWLSAIPEAVLGQRPSLRSKMGKHGLCRINSRGTLLVYHWRQQLD